MEYLLSVVLQWAEGTIELQILTDSCEDMIRTLLELARDAGAEKLHVISCIWTREA